jgi:hypothetical protein
MIESSAALLQGLSGSREIAAAAKITEGFIVFGRSGCPADTKDHRHFTESVFSPLVASVSTSIAGTRAAGGPAHTSPRRGPRHSIGPKHL